MKTTVEVTIITFHNPEIDETVSIIGGSEVEGDFHAIQFNDDLFAGEPLYSLMERIPNEVPGTIVKKTILTTSIEL